MADYATPCCTVDDLSALTSLDTSATPTGTTYKVSSLRDTWSFEKDSTLSDVPFEVITDPNGAWVRNHHPDVSWVHNPEWWIDPANGSDENIGTDSAYPLATVREFLRRCQPNFLWTPTTGLTVHVMRDINEDIQIQADFNMTPGFGSFLLFTADLAPQTGNTTITAVQAHNSSTNTVGALTVSGSTFWAGKEGMVGVIQGGARAGACFVVAKNLGSGKGQISAVGAGPYDPTPITLQTGDVFKLYTQTKFGGLLVVNGSGIVNFENLEIGTTVDPYGHSATVYEATAFFTCCHFPNGLNSEDYAYVDVSHSDIQLGCRAQNYSELILSGNVVRGASPLCRAGAIIWSYNATVFGKIRLEKFSSLRVDTGWWLSVHDTTTAIKVDPGGEVDTRGGKLWGTGVAGPRIEILPGGSFIYSTGAAPNLAGSGTEMYVGGTGGTTTFAGLPSFNANNGSKVVVST